MSVTTEPADDVESSPVDTPSTDKATDSSKSAVLVAAGILLSRISGVIRTIFLSAFLGRGPAADAFNAALKIPNMLQNLLGEGVLSASFIPVYSRLLADDDRDAARGLAGAVVGLLVALTGALVVIGLVLARPITSVVLRGFRASPENFDLTVSLVRIMTPGMGFLVLSAWCLGILNSHRRFFLSYVSPVLWNIAQIAALVGVVLAGVGDSGRAIAVAIGTVAGGLLQFLIQIPRVLELVPNLRPSLSVGSGAVRSVLARFVPAVFARGIVQISTLVDLFLASFLASGAVSMLAYSQTLYILPISLFGMSIAAAELPELSRLGAGAVDAVDARLRQGLNRIAFFVMFCAVAYVTAGRWIVQLIFERGATTPNDTVAIWLILGSFSLGIVASTMSRLWQSALYAAGDVRVPALIALMRAVVAGFAGAALMIVFDDILVVDERVTGLNRLFSSRMQLQSAELRTFTEFPHLGAVGLGLASSLAAWCQLVWITYRGRQLLGVRCANWWPILRLVPATIIAGLAMVQLGYLVQLPILLKAPIVIGLGGIAYLLAARRFGSTEARALLDRGFGLIRR